MFDIALLYIIFAVLFVILDLLVRFIITTFFCAGTLHFTDEKDIYLSMNEEDFNKLNRYSHALFSIKKERRKKN